MSDLTVQLTAPNGRTYAQPLGLFINNEFVASKSGKRIDSINPSDESVIASVYAAGPEDVDIAVQAARNALNSPEWEDLPPTERGQMMTRLADMMEENKELFATIDAWDNGKPYSEALEGDLPEAIGTIRYYAGWADKTFGQTINTTSAKFAYTIRQPIGVVGQIIPWNYPLSMAAWKLGPAIACGNTVVLKAAEQTPLSVLVLGTLIRQIFPPGVINIINGLGQDAGSALVQHADVDKVAFTGSTATARKIMQMASATLKNITLETGGKSPLIVFGDARTDLAVKWAHIGIMSNKGEICTATSRIFVEESVYDDFLAQFKSLTESSTVGDPFESATFQGPQVSQAQFNRVLAYIEQGKKEGATVLTGGQAQKKDGKGFFIAPTIFTDVTPDMTIYKEEIFGPVAVVVKFKAEKDALQMANDTTYGLGAAVFTENLVRGHRMARKIESGMVWINSSQDCDFRVPFGGVKQSGIGRELGEAGLEGYSQIKAVHVNMDPDA
ncbi:hypothetical protein ASPWEDRAFT_172797 [Aspergillus wentii DTO 134E9]|uniref:Aldehyde dehydrogenase domain-containing protein n=1 Tax=Aspergillus wentii DTO 134E9 TaxID=1073089 RepID=A0A1L9RM62_ASPWE|nr:uncharacterized protein ASPWEDRAFT_172797 [Aspergillus wentii DTO 134E9]KAI9929547.1 hypothetical protein MW887_001020 [Aspergillus wentii]OJJ36011.1 hypothetical protein ASPWEDRAFT_172797 [Aspergillus wentii DTO 134E9]